jgi:hypothetical protein
MLVVTTTVRMVDGVHGHTTSLGPAVALGSELFPSQYRISRSAYLRTVLYA